MRKAFFTSLTIFIGFLVVASFAQALTIDNPIRAQTIQQLIEDIITAVRNVVAALSVIAFIVASILYATSSGLPERMQQAKSFLIYTIIGVAIILVAQAVINTLQSIFQ